MLVCLANTTEYDNYKMANQALTRPYSNIVSWEGNPLHIAQLLTPVTRWTWQSCQLVFHAWKLALLDSITQILAYLVILVLIDPKVSALSDELQHGGDREYKSTWLLDSQMPYESLKIRFIYLDPTVLISMLKHCVRHPHLDSSDIKNSDIIWAAFK